MLARPVPHKIETQVDGTADLTPDDERHLERFGELSARLQDQLSENAWRNRLVVDTYQRGPDGAGATTFGKTIVFAINRAHCELMARLFEEAGIRADSIYYTKGLGPKTL